MRLGTVGKSNTDYNLFYWTIPGLFFFVFVLSIVHSTCYVLDFVDDRIQIMDHSENGNTD